MFFSYVVGITHDAIRSFASNGYHHLYDYIYVYKGVKHLKKSHNLWKHMLYIQKSVSSYTTSWIKKICHKSPKAIIRRRKLHSPFSLKVSELILFINKFSFYDKIRQNPCQTFLIFSDTSMHIVFRSCL